MCPNTYDKCGTYFLNFIYLFIFIIQVITNIGNSYDARHGQFRAQANGTYEFSVALLMGPGYWAGLEIVRNGNPIAKVRSGDSQHYSMSATAVTAEVTSLSLSLSLCLSLCLSVCMRACVCAAPWK